ncbi:MAG: ribose 5-phosphate isomerase B [Clostridia bacterium]|nr:ribose 5-phosphate isomerase B [Clostridia bacterium]
MIALSSDHAGYPLKEEIRAYLEASGIEYKDCGAFGTASVDYPVQAKKACDLVADGTCGMAILCCGTGVGMSMAANKIKGIRAACCTDYFSAKFTRLHNDANVLCLGARVLGAGAAIELVNVFLNTPFEGGERHRRRVDLMMALENE